MTLSIYHPEVPPSLVYQPSDRPRVLGAGMWVNLLVNSMGSAAVAAWVGFGPKSC